MSRNTAMMGAIIALVLVWSVCASAQESFERNGTRFTSTPWGAVRPRPELTQQEQERGWVTFVPSQFDGIGPEAYPTRTEIESPLLVVACAGEFEPATFGVYTERKLDAVTAQPGRLLDAKKSVIPPWATEVRAVRIWRQRTSWNTSEYYTIPELLEKRETLGIPQRGLQQYWVTVAVPPQTRPGVYEGYVRVSAGNDAVHIPLKVRVLPFRLAPSKAKKWGLWPDTSRWRDFSDEEILREMRNWRAHGINTAIMYPLTHGKFSLEDGKLKSDLSEFERFMDIYVEAGLEEPVVASLQNIAGLVHGLLGQEPDDYGLEFAELALRITGTIENLRKAKKWPEFVYHTVDEPGGHAPVQKEALETLRILHDGGFKTYTTADVTFANEVLDPYLDVRCYGIGFCTRSEAQAQARRAECDAAGDAYWWYGTGCYTGQEGSVAVNRHYSGFLFAKSKADAAWAWTFQRPKGSAYDDFDGQGNREEKDACITYPQPDGRPPLVPTLQWEGIREGIDDYRYLEILQMAINDLQTQDTPANRALVRKAKQELNDILDSVPWLGPNELSCTQAEVYRWRIGELILDCAATLGKERFETPGSTSAVVRTRTGEITCAFGGSGGADAELPYPGGHAPMFRAAPQIDGKLEQTWHEAFTIENLVSPDGSPNEHNTKVFIGRDRTNLYVAFQCAEDEMDKIRAAATEHDGDVWTDDSVELFIDAGGDQRTYAHFAVNSLGTKREAWHTRSSADPTVQAAEDMSTTENLGWDPEWQVGTAPCEGGWCAEIAIPIGELRGSAAGVWNVNFNRTRRVPNGSEYGCWSPTVSGFHVPSRFGKLSMSAGALQIAEVEFSRTTWGDNAASLVINNPLGVAEVDFRVHATGGAPPQAAQSYLLYPGLNEIDASFDLRRVGQSEVAFEITPRSAWRDVDSVPLQTKPRAAGRPRPSNAHRLVKFPAVPTRVRFLRWALGPIATNAGGMQVLQGRPGFDFPVSINLGDRLRRDSRLELTVFGPRGIVSEQSVTRIGDGDLLLNVGTQALRPGTYRVQVSLEGRDVTKHTVTVPFTVAPGPWDS